MKDFFEKRKSRLEAKIKALADKALASTDADEVRAINAEIADIREEVKECDAAIRSYNADPTPPANAQLVNGSNVFSTKQEERDDDPTSKMEYRKAFMAFVQNGTPIPAEARAAISTADTGAAIPITVMREVINTVRKRYGNLYNKVRKTNVPGGVEYPIGALKATFKWIKESTVSPRQKVDPLAKISFSYHTAEIRVAQSFLSNILTIDAFEAALAEVIAVAYLEAMDYAIVRGTGDGMPLGIINDPRVTNYITMTEADMSNWTKWRKNFFANLPLGYRDGEFIFSMATVDGYLETMADSNNNPIFRQATGLEVNDGDAVNPNGRFFGREISLVEPEILPDFATADANAVIGIFWQPMEYAINENFGFTMRRYFDEETNEWVDKALVVVDGKVLNPNGIWLIKKGS